MPTLTNLTVNLVGDSSKLNKAVDSAKKNLAGLTLFLGKAAVASGLLGAAALGAAGIGLTALGRVFAKNIDEAAKLAQQYGLTEDQIKGLGLTARLGGTDLQSLLKAMEKGTQRAREFALGITEDEGLIESMKDAKVTADQLSTSLGNTGKKGAAAFGSLANPLKFIGDKSKELGEETKRGFEFKSLNEIASKTNSNVKTGLLPTFTKLGQIMNNIEDPVKRLAAIKELFGTTKIAPALDDFINQLEQNIKFTEFWRGSTNELSGSVENMDDQVERLTTALSLMGERITVEFAGPIGEAIETFRLWMRDFIEAQGGIDALAEAITTRLVGAFNKLKEILSEVNEKWQEVKEAFSLGAGLLEQAGVGVGQVIATGGAGPGAVTGGQGFVTKEMLNKMDAQREATDEQTRILKEKLSREGANLGFGP